jgi:hypothetical protein
VASAGTNASEPSNPTNGLPIQQTNKIRFRVPALNVTEKTEKHPEDNLPIGPTASTKEKGADKEDLYNQEIQINLNTQGNKRNSKVEVTNPMGKDEPSNSTPSVNTNSTFTLEDPPTDLSNKGELTHASELDTASTLIADTNVKGGTLGASSHDNVTTFACACKVQPSNGNNNVINQNQNQVTFHKQTLTNDTQKNLPYSATITQPLYLPNSYINNPLPITPTAAPTKNNSLQNIPTGNLYKYGFTDNSITPKENYIISLEPKLECLRPLIMSQPEAFTPYIIDMGKTNLTHPKVINKKKESLTQLSIGNKIPRSLRLKCELTTSPNYSSNAKFLRIKESLQNATDSYIKTGIALMKEWAEENILLLQQDRCLAILSKALQILDGISLYNSEVIFKPHWFTSSQKHNTLILLKIYLLNEFIDITEIIEYLEVPIDTICLLSSKILNDISTDENAIKSFEAITLNDKHLNHENVFNFVSETLITFDQILRATTIDIWANYKEHMKQISAAITLKSRMAAFNH